MKVDLFITSQGHRPLKRWYQTLCFCLLNFFFLNQAKGSSATTHTWFVPKDVKAIHLPDNFRYCPKNSGVPEKEDIWSLPDNWQKNTQRKLLFTESDKNCSQGIWVVLAALDKIPVAFMPSTILYVDKKRIDIKGNHLLGSVLSWKKDNLMGYDTCRDPSMSNDEESCSFFLSNDFPANQQDISFTLWPNGMIYESLAVFFDNKGYKNELTRPNDWLPNRIVLQDLIPQGSTIDTLNEVSRIELLYPEFIQAVECIDAICSLENSQIIVRNEKGKDDSLDVKLFLKSRIYVENTQGLTNKMTYNIPLQRCPFSLISPAPFRNVAEQKIVLKIGGKCAKEINSLQYIVQGNAVNPLRYAVEADTTYVVLPLDWADGEHLLVSLQNKGFIWGIARVKMRYLPRIQARLWISELGDLDFIPTNRSVAVIVPKLPDGGVFIPKDVDGVYNVSINQDQTMYIKGVEGAAGWANLRYVLKDPKLPPSLRDLELLYVSDSLNRSLHPANIPVALGASSLTEQAIVTLHCVEKDLGYIQITPGVTTSIDFSNRDSCRLGLHTEKLSPEDGMQTIRLQISVTGADGFSRPEAQREEKIRLQAGEGPLYRYLQGITFPFDRLVIRATNITDDGAYREENATEIGTEVQWSLIAGRDNFRMFGTTSIPTGLYRMAIDYDKGPNGILGLNGGILMRFVALSNEGRIFPVGLETGVVWLNIAGDKTIGRGQIALVAGIGISIPFANMARMTQAAVGLHIWAEYEVSRAIDKQSIGTPWGLVFGPSISIGNVGLNF